MRRPYRVLAILSALFNVLGVICILVGVGLAVYSVYQALQVPEPVVTAALLNGAVFLVSGIITGLLWMALGQLLRLLMDMAASARQTELYTRTTVKLLQRQLSRPATAPRVAPQSTMPRSSVDLDEEFSFLG